MKCHVRGAETVLNLKSFERSPHLAEIKVAYRRKKREDSRQTKMPWVLVSPTTAESYLRSIWNNDTIELTEDFIIVCLNTAREVLGWVKGAAGGLDGAAVDVRVVFAIALQTASSAIILAHNHPSGSLKPSQEDMALTKRLQHAGELLQIPVLDHVILTKDGAFSFSDQGLL
jgi:DNA repair protein RadC